jgi:hypothetical protein
MRYSLSLAATIACVAFMLPVSAAAASPLAALPIGSSIKYHITTQSVSQDGSQQNSSHFVRFKRVAESAIQVTLDGAPAGEITIGNGANVQIPPGLQSVLAPFREIALYMRGAPRPLSANASWAATLPVPIKDQTDDVAVVLSVTNFGMSGATVVAKGGNSTDVQPRLRSFPADVSVHASLQFSAGKVLTSASRTVSIDVKVGRFGARQKHGGDTWSVTQV